VSAHTYIYDLSYQVIFMSHDMMILSWFHVYYQLYNLSVF